MAAKARRTSQRVLALADGARAPGRARSTCAGDVAPLRWSLPSAGGTGSDQYLLKPDLPRHSIQTQTDGPWRDPDAAKGVRSACPCPTGSEPASSVAGASCPITPNAMMTRCSAADFLGWVRRIFTLALVNERVHGHGTRTEPACSQSPSIGNCPKKDRSSPQTETPGGFVIQGIASFDCP